MSNITLLRSGLDVSWIYWRLLSNPHLWNQNSGRTISPDSPHHQLDDIWVRFGSEEDQYTDNPHKANWYPSAKDLGVAPLCLDIMRAYNGTELGGVLITRIPPGCTCRPHKDLGWHARTYEKIAIQIMSAPGQAFCFEGEQLETKPGDVYWFNNQEIHWVINPTEYERITMIVCVRVEKE